MRTDDRGAGLSCGPEDAIVIIGAGQAGATTAVTLRDAGHTGPITLIGAERHLPYQRPPLSKKLLTSGAGAAQLVLHGEEAFRSRAIDLLLGTRVEQLEREARQVILADGRALPYDHVVLATGARNRTLPVDIEGAKAVSLRDWDDAESLRDQLAEAESVLIVGAGMIGLEVAASARELDKNVVVLEGSSALLPRHVSRPVADFLLALHTSKGVRVHCGAVVETLLTGESGRVAGARTSQGEFRADLVVDAVGVVPETTIAEDAGLAVEGGIEVDPWLRSSDARISAVGDCATIVDPAGSRLHLESVQNANDQGSYVARRLIGSVTAPYSAVPWFWSNQYGTRIQMAGLPQPDQVEVASTGGGRFSVYCFNDDSLHRVESVGMAGEHLAARKVLGSGRSPDLETTRRNDFSLKSWWSKRAGNYDVSTKG